MSEGGHEEEGNAERWLLTYADMITLLMAFFLMMYSMSVVNQNKFQELALSVRSGFNGKEPGSASDTLGIGSRTQVLETVLPAASFEMMSRIEGQVRRGLPGPVATQVDVVAEGGTVTLRVRADDVLFERGSATLTPSASTTLAAISGVIRPLNYETRIEGHTCDLPIHTPQFPTNWDLSARRAIAVLLYMMEWQGYLPAQLSAVGYADTKPVVANTSEANRARNRRIDIVLVRPRGTAGADVPPADLRASVVPDLGPPRVAVATQPAGGEVSSQAKGVTH